jgi:hypothetical protein
MASPQGVAIQKKNWITTSLMAPPSFAPAGFGLASCDDGKRRVLIRYNVRAVKRQIQGQ